jgi:hypothetical protein
MSFSFHPSTGVGFDNDDDFDEAMILSSQADSRNALSSVVTQEYLVCFFPTDTGIFLTGA